MRILLHGATNLESSNFGDFIYGNGVYSIIKECLPNCSVHFYQPSNFFIKYTEGYVDNQMNEEFSALIYIPGGYFIQEERPTITQTMIRFLRYIPIGLSFIMRKKQIAVIGVGAGPIKSKILRYSIYKLWKSAKVFTVRDDESVNYLKLIGIYNVRNYSDMILSFSLKEKGKRTIQIDEILKKASSRPIFLIHYNSNLKALKLFAESVKLFNKKNRDYFIVVSSDSIIANEDKLFKDFSKTVEFSVSHFYYNDPFEFLELLKSINLMLTCKLHAGVVSCMFGKSVVCAAINAEKTRRFYSQIYRSDCFVDINKASPEIIVEMLENSILSPIKIQEELINKSSLHKRELETFLKNLNE